MIHKMNKSVLKRLKSKAKYTKEELCSKGEKIYAEIKNHAKAYYGAKCKRTMSGSADAKRLSEVLVKIK